MPKVMIVDDSKIFRKVVEHIIGAEYSIAGSVGCPLEGLALINQSLPDVILLDITMPNMSGKEALREILGKNPSAKVIMVTSVGDEETVSECLKIGAKAFVSKDKVRSGDGRDSVLMKAIQSAMGAVPQQEAA